VPKEKRNEAKTKRLVLGDDAIRSFDADWLSFRRPATKLAEHLYKISKSSGICCGIVGPWGSGKSSFMKLMEEYIRKESHWKKVHIVWFTAWDPGGIQDLGDAMLHHFFREVAGENRKMLKALNELREALRIRRSLRERVHRALEDVSEALPAPSRAATKVLSGLVGELDSPLKVQLSYEKLMKWLEDEGQTVFFFVDDVGRATGKQIRDLLSELKLYISHRRIVAVLAYDEDYVLKALKPPVLPIGIDPKRYLEKIVTIRRRVPTPSSRDFRIYAQNLIISDLKLEEELAQRLAVSALTLCGDNPRKLKSIILLFTQLLASSVIEHENDLALLQSLLFTSATAYMSFLTDDNIRTAIEAGEEERIEEAINKFTEKEPSKRKEADNLIREISRLKPGFRPRTLTGLGLYERRGTLYLGPDRAPSRVRSAEAFDWSVSFLPILEGATKQGFKLPSEAATPSSEVVVGPVAMIKNVKTRYARGPMHVMRAVRRYLRNDGWALSWNQHEMVILFTSSFASRRSADSILRVILNNSTYFAAQKCFILWVIDDVKMYKENDLRNYIERAQEMCKGLRNPFIFQYTLSSQINNLLRFLLKVR